MKEFKKYLFYSLLVLAFACQEDDNEFGAVTAPTDLTVTVDIAPDNSGNVAVNASASGALYYHVYFLSGADPVVISDGETANFRYVQSGTYTQEISVVAFGAGGVSTSAAVVVDLTVILQVDPVLLENLAGAPGEGKTWIWDSSNAGHFGVGAVSETFPNFFSAGANQLNPCLYDDQLTFEHDGQGNYRYTIETQAATFINWAEIRRFFPDITPVQFEDQCLNIDDQILIDTSFVIVEDPDAGKTFLTVEESTLSYWSGAMEYEIVELTEDKLVVRGIQIPFDPPGEDLAWYHTFVPADDGGPALCSAFTGATGSGNNDVLVWAEEFDEPGAPCSDTWSYNLGNGDNGWGNGESQYYTDRPENVIVENGNLVITARAEEFEGFDYTSARLITFQNFDFEYGRVEARAKLPTGGGTWPAIWLLGSDFQTETWPACGEMDIMEHVGNLQDRIFSSLHYPGNSGGNAVSQDINVPGVSDTFHTYGLNWTPDIIEFSVDGEVYHTIPNNSTLPFDNEFFIIVNVAMGGNFGGNIDPAFESSSMEIDYIRVYQ